jgi:dimethylhistidine N-methyltransferase
MTTMVFPHPAAASRLVRQQMRTDVLNGLRSRPKMLPCKYFYDEAGSQLFEQITTLEEYYPTRTELALMQQHDVEMADLMGPRCLLIEYGSGSSTKTRLLLDQLREPAGYVPVDISGAFLRSSAQALSEQYPDLAVLPICADFTEPAALPLPATEASRRIVYFPGSTIGNLTPQQAIQLLRRTAGLVGLQGGLLLGVDLKKDRRVLEEAYNDSRGVTAAFNRNLLVRINRELGADFAVDHFAHRAFYNGEEGRIEMHLVSDRRQRVTLGPTTISLGEGESICTEYSYKYELQELNMLATAARFRLDRIWTDERHYFSVAFLTASLPRKRGE